MKPVSLYLLIVLIMIPILAVLSYTQFRSAFTEQPGSNQPTIDFPKLDNALEGIPFEESADRVTWNDQGRKIRLAYGSSWIKADSDTIDQAETLLEPGEEDLLLFLFKVNLSNVQPAYLVIEKLKAAGWEEIMGTAQKEAAANGQAMEITRSTIKENRVSLEIKYNPLDPKAEKKNISFRQMEEILLDEDASYVVSIITTEQNWPSLQPEAAEILGSIEFSGQLAKKSETATGKETTESFEPPADNLKENVSEKTTEPPIAE